MLFRATKSKQMLLVGKSYIIFKYIYIFVLEWEDSLKSHSLGPILRISVLNIYLDF